jgi:hypothetical protein
MLRYYRKEYAEISRSRSLFFKKIADSLNKDLKVGLNFSVRNYSIILKYLNYIWILGVAFFR